MLIAEQFKRMFETKIAINISDNNVQLLRNVIKSVLPRQKV